VRPLGRCDSAAHNVSRETSPSVASSTSSSQHRIRTRGRVRTCHRTERHVRGHHARHSIAVAAFHVKRGRPSTIVRASWIIAGTLPRYQGRGTRQWELTAHSNRVAVRRMNHTEGTSNKSRTSPRHTSLPPRCRQTRLPRARASRDACTGFHLDVPAGRRNDSGTHAELRLLMRRSERMRPDVDEQQRDLVRSAPAAKSSPRRLATVFSTSITRAETAPNSHR